jgi:hypothetical protein
LKLRFFPVSLRRRRYPTKPRVAQRTLGLFSSSPLKPRWGFPNCDCLVRTSTLGPSLALQAWMEWLAKINNSFSRLLTPLYSGVLYPLGLSVTNRQRLGKSQAKRARATEGHLKRQQRFASELAAPACARQLSRLAWGRSRVDFGAL